jgi:hypothetical protein
MWLQPWLSSLPGRPAATERSRTSCEPRRPPQTRRVTCCGAMPVPQEQQSRHCARSGPWRLNVGGGRPVLQPVLRRRHRRGRLLGRRTCCCTARTNTAMSSAVVTSVMTVASTCACATAVHETLAELVYWVIASATQVSLPVAVARDGGADVYHLARASVCPAPSLTDWLTSGGEMGTLVRLRVGSGPGGLDGVGRDKPAVFGGGDDCQRTRPVPEAVGQ